MQSRLPGDIGATRNMEVGKGGRQGWMARDDVMLVFHISVLDAHSGRTRDGKTLEVETLRVARARECRDMYRALTAETGNRISMLHTLKKYILGHTCSTSRDLGYLITQELDFSTKNFDPSMMNQLRKRVKLAFFQFILNCCEPKRRNGNCEDGRKLCVR